jgi:hypothetical protein
LLGERLNPGRLARCWELTLRHTPFANGTKGLILFAVRGMSLFPGSIRITDGLGHFFMTREASAWVKREVLHSFDEATSTRFLHCSPLLRRQHNSPK